MQSSREAGQFFPHTVRVRGGFPCSLWRVPHVGSNADNESNAEAAALNANNEASNANVNNGAAHILNKKEYSKRRKQPHHLVEHDAGIHTASRVLDRRAIRMRA